MRETTAARCAASSTRTPGTARRSSFRGVGTVAKLRALSRKSAFEALHGLAVGRCFFTTWPRSGMDACLSIVACINDHARVDAFACGEPKALKTSGFEHACMFASRASRDRALALPVPFAAQRAGTVGERVKTRRRRVLTPKKTVIRFRHNKTWPQKRVSATRTTTRNTTQSSARMVDTVDSGVALSSKAPGPRMHATRGAVRSGFFRVEGPARGSVVRSLGDTGQECPGTESGATRPARRRLIAGPIPAVCFVLGRSTCKSH